MGNLMIYVFAKTNIGVYHKGNRMLASGMMQSGWGIWHDLYIWQVFTSSA